MKLMQARAMNVVVGLLFFVAGGVANVIPVTNPSFEILPSGGLPFGCGTGCFFSEAAIPDWTSTGPGPSGQFQPGTQDGTTFAFSSLSDGITNGYSNGGTLSQTVGATVQGGVIYTLKVDLGFRNDESFAASADLLVNGVKYNATGTTPVRGNWSTFTATYTGLAADVGDAITIQLNSSGDQGNFDNVRLSNNVSAVPEPAFLGVVGFGLTALLAFARRKHSV